MGDKYDDALRDINFILQTILFPETPLLKIHEHIVWAVMECRHITEIIRGLDDTKQDPTRTTCGKDGGKC